MDEEQIEAKAQELITQFDGLPAKAVEAVFWRAYALATELAVVRVSSENPEER